MYLSLIHTKSSGFLLQRTSRTVWKAYFDAEASEIHAQTYCEGFNSISRCIVAKSKLQISAALLTSLKTPTAAYECAGTHLTLCSIARAGKSKVLEIIISN